MRRRDFLALAGGLAAAPRVAVAQPVANMPRLAVLTYSALQPATVQSFLQGLGDLGYVDGKTITIEYFVAPTNADLPSFADKVVASRPDIV